MVRLAAALAAREFSVDLVVGKAVGPLLNAVPADVRVVDLNARRVLASLPPLVRYLRTEAPAVLLAALTHANVVAITAARMAGRRTRVVVSEQNTISQFARNADLRRDRLTPRAARWTYGKADAVVAVSQGAADDLLRTTRVPEERVHVIPNPIVAPEIFERAREHIDDPWFDSGEPPVVLALGRLAPQKDFPTLIHAFALARRMLPARLLILGEGSERARLEALVRRLGLQDDVLLPGLAANPYPYVAGSSLLVLSSAFEGLPAVLVEALALGTPVVSTDCESGPREILDGGRYGRLVPLGDVQALAENVASVLENGAPSPPRESWEPYSVDAVLDDYLKVLMPDGER
jgi:glycosyltransferase involved in cell wall biosynthesis